jgi:hypothetical protein
VDQPRRRLGARRWPASPGPTLSVLDPAVLLLAVVPAPALVVVVVVLSPVLLLVLVVVVSTPLLLLVLSQALLLVIAVVIVLVIIVMPVIAVVIVLVIIARSFVAVGAERPCAHRGSASAPATNSVQRAADGHVRRRRPVLRRPRSPRSSATRPSIASTVSGSARS